MVAFSKSGPDIIKALRHAHAELAESEPLGVVASFCKDARVERDPARKRVEIVATLTTDDIDLDKERVLPEGIDFDTYLLKNRNVFVDHDYNLMSCVGKFRAIARKSNGIECRVQMLNSPDNPLIGAVIAMAEAGGIGMSLGFSQKQGGPATAEEQRRYPGKAYLVRKCMAVEGSFTCMPCNVSSQSGAITYADEKAMGRMEVLVKSRVPKALWGRMGMQEKARRVVVCVGM